MAKLEGLSVPDGLSVEHRLPGRDPAPTPRCEQDGETRQGGSMRRGLLRLVGDVRTPYSPPPELVRDTIPAVGVGFLGGQSGAYKSFTAVELGVCVNTGHPFAGRKIEATGAVLYIACEGAGTLEGRLRARRSRLPDPHARLPFYVLSDFGPISGKVGFETFARQIEADAAAIAAECGQPLRLVILDTVAASGMIPEDKENDPAAWTRIFDLFGVIARRIGAAVMLVHHYGKDSGAGLRGSSNARAGADFVLAMTCTRDEITGDSRDHHLALTKSRDWPEGSIASVSTEEVEIGHRADSSPVTSLVLNFNAGTKMRRVKRPTRAAAAFVDAYLASMAEGAERVHVHGDASAPVVAAVPLHRVREAFHRLYATGEADEKRRADNLRKQFANALKQLPDGIATGSWCGTEWAWRASEALDGTAE